MQLIQLRETRWTLNKTTLKNSPCAKGNAARWSWRRKILQTKWMFQWVWRPRVKTGWRLLHISLKKSVKTEENTLEVSGTMIRSKKVNKSWWFHNQHSRGTFFEKLNHFFNVLCSLVCTNDHQKKPFLTDCWLTLAWKRRQWFYNHQCLSINIISVWIGECGDSLYTLPRRLLLPHYFLIRFPWRMKRHVGPHDEATRHGHAPPLQPISSCTNLIMPFLFFPQLQISAVCVPCGGREQQIMTAMMK